jgi:hypothetical protein
MKDLEKLTKNELITVIKEQEKRTLLLESDKQRYKDLENELRLLNFLYDDYVPTMKENKRLNDSVYALQQRTYDLEDLCNRQQKIIDSRCN